MRPNGLHRLVCVPVEQQSHQSGWMDITLVCCEQKVYNLIVTGHLFVTGTTGFVPGMFLGASRPRWES